MLAENSGTIFVFFQDSVSRKTIFLYSILVNSKTDGHKQAMQWSVHLVKHGMVHMYVKQIQQKILKHAYM